jgi:hypothetical protein
MEEYWKGNVVWRQKSAKRLIVYLICVRVNQPKYNQPQNIGLRSKKIPS